MNEGLSLGVLFVMACSRISSCARLLLYVEYAGTKEEGDQEVYWSNRSFELEVLVSGSDRLAGKP